MDFIEGWPQAVAFICLCLCLVIIVVAITSAIKDVKMIEAEAQYENSPEVIAEYARQVRADKTTHGEGSN